MPKCDSYRLVRTASIAAPAVRCVVLTSFANRGDSGAWEVGREVHAVLALIATVAAEYSRYHRPGDHRRPGSEADLERDGWQHDATGAEYDVLVDSPDYGLCDGRMAFDGVNEAHKVVVCPWPPEEDEARFAPVFAELEAEAIRRAERDEKGRAPVAARSEVIAR